MRINVKAFTLVLTLLIFTASWGFSYSGEEERFHIAAKAFSDDFYDASLSLFKRFINDFPESSLIYEAKLYIAKCYYRKEDYARALSTLTEVERGKPGDDVLSETYHWLSVIYFKGRDFDEALSYADKIVQSHPKSRFIWETQYLLASCKLELGNKDQAKELFNKIIVECPQEEVLSNAYSQALNLYLQKKEYPQIISLAKKYISEFPKGELKAKVYFYLGEAYYATDEWNKALKSYRSALRAIPGLELKDLIHQGIGFTYIEKGSKIEAKNNIDKIKNKELRLFSQGVYYFKTQDYIQALETFNIFIRDYPKSKVLIDSCLNKADTLYEMGRLNDSISVYKYVLGNFKVPQHIDSLNKAHYGLAWCYLKNGKFKEAIAEFKSTLEYTNNPVVELSSRIQIADAYQ